MDKFIFSVILVFFATAKLAAQDESNESPKELLLAIQKSKPDTNRISLQLKLGQSYLLDPPFKKPAEYKRRLDSAFAFFNRALQLSISLHETDWQFNALRSIGIYYIYVNDCDRCKKTFMQVIDHYQQTGNIDKEADAWVEFAQQYGQCKRYDNVQEVISKYQHARFLYLQNNQPVQAAGVLRDIGGCRLTFKQFGLAEKDLRQSLAEYKACGYKKLQQIYMTLVDLEYLRGNYYRAIAYCIQGINKTAPGESVLYSSFFYWQAARCNYAVKNYPEALEWIRKAMAFGTPLQEYNYLKIEALLALNLTGEARSALNEISNFDPPPGRLDSLDLYRAWGLYYEKIKKNELAAHCFLLALKIVDKSEPTAESTPRDYLHFYNAIARVYLNAEQAPKAEKYIKNAAFTFKNARFSLEPEYFVEFYDNSYRYALATGNYVAAVKCLQHRVKLQDSLFTADKDKQLAELNIQYQTAQQEQSIKNLHSQNVAQQAKLEKANLERNITIGGILVMIFISTLFYRTYKQKQKTNNIIANKNELLQHLLSEKEWLLKEVHHRVKNNLHTVICLLESQAAYLENDALKAIETSQNRIYAMSLIHQKLYQSDDIKNINMAEYIPELVKSLEGVFGASDQILFGLNIDPIDLNLSHAIPIALIINEAVTNSIKYAFPNNSKGEIFISMLNDGNWIKLEIADNGIGMPLIDMEDEPESLGLRLMKGLSDDIDAAISFEVNNGTKITIVFNPGELNNTKGILKPTEIKEEYV